MELNQAAPTRAQELIEAFDLKSHPEGGYYREFYRSSASVRPGDGRGARSAVTAIYYLLTAGQHSRWHRVRSDEIWQFCEGEPLELFISAPALPRIERVVLGPAPASRCLTHTVPADWWQAARPEGAYSLVTCTVAPGFDFADFTLLCDDPAAAEALGRLDSSTRTLA